MKRTYWLSLILIFTVILTFSVSATALAIEKRRHNQAGINAPGEQVEMRKQTMKKIMVKRWLEKEMPELLEKIEETQSEYPDAVRKFQRDLKKNEKQNLFRGPARGKMDKETRALLQSYLENELKSHVLSQKISESTDDREKDQLKRELKDVLTKSFEIKAEIQEKVITKMEQRIRKLRDLLEKRKDLKEQIISERIENITNDTKLTEW